MDNGGVGSNPCNMLEHKSKYLIFFQGRMFRGSSKPLKWLKERLKDCNVSFPTFQNHLGTLPSICYWKGLNIVIHLEILGKLEIQVSCKNATSNF